MSRLMALAQLMPLSKGITRIFPVRAPGSPEPSAVIGAVAEAMGVLVRTAVPGRRAGAFTVQSRSRWIGAAPAVRARPTLVWVAPAGVPYVWWWAGL